MQRIGHKGAHLIEPGNTIASFNLARSLAVDMIEFDVLRWNDQLVIAHDLADAAARDGNSLLTLEQALTHFATPDFAELGLDIDLKHEGFELELIAALQRHGLVDRSTLTTMSLASLRLIRSRSADLRLGLTIPHVTVDWLNKPAVLKPLIAAAAMLHRLTQPTRVARELRRGQLDAVMAFHAIVGRRLVKTVHRHGAELYVWTVDDAAIIDRLVKLGVDGIVSNDPRLFDALQLDAAQQPPDEVEQGDEQAVVRPA